MFGQSFTSAKSPFLVGLFLVCMCGLMLQIIDTRILSVVAFYHLAFFAISMAMFGMTAGSLFVYFKSRFFPVDRLFQNLSWIGAAFSVAVVLSALLMISTVVATIPHSPVMSALLWVKLIAILIPPYFFAGMAISLALTRSPWPVGLVYGVDMIGAATGCLGVLALLEWMDAVSALFAVGAIAAVGSACFAAAGRAGGDAISSSTIHLPGIARLALLRHPARLAVIFAVLAVLNAIIQPHGITLSVVKNHLETDRPAVLRWNSFSRIKAGQDQVGEPAMWGPSPISPKVTVSQRWMNIDGLAGTSMYHFSGNFADLDFLRYDVTNLAYIIRNHGRSAVIGVGGGRDLLSAYMFGIHDVTGVELNPIFIDMLTGPFRYYNEMVGLPGIRLLVDEARSWFARTSERFDLIEMSLIDTWAATGAGAFSLSENGLYTVQGWHHFLDALTPTGVFTVSRWYDPTNLAEIGRLLSLAATTLRSRGVEQPDAHIFLAGTPVLATLIVAKAPFTADDLTRLRARTEELGFKVLLSPGLPAAAPVLRQVVEANSPDEIAESVAYLSSGRYRGH